MGRFVRFMGRWLARNAWRYGLLAFALALLAVFLLYPIALTIRGGFDADPSRPASLWEWVNPSGWTLDHLKRDFTLEHLGLVFRDPVLLGGLLNSLKIAAATTALAIVIALPLALLAARYKFPFKGAFGALILVPLILPPFVGAIGARAILGQAGALNALLGADLDILGRGKFWGVVIVQALSLYPIIYLNATAALANLDPALDEAAENLGAGPWRRLVRITLPLIRPGLFAGATIVFIWSLTELGTPLMFDYNIATPVQIFMGLKEVENSAQPYALAFVLLALALAVYVAGRLIFGGRGHAMYSKASRASMEKPMSPAAGWAAAGAFGLVTGLSLLPHLGVLLMSVTPPGQWYRSVLPTAFTLSHYRDALTAPDSFGAIVNSLKLASAAMVLDVVLGVMIAYLIVRTRVVGRNVLDALCMLPLAVPGLVMAFGYVAMSLRWPFGKGDPLEDVISIFGADPNPFPLLIIAYAVRRLPYIVRSTAAGLEQTSGELEEAAVNLGASKLAAIRRVVVPLIMANLIAGALLVFSFSMLEVSDSLMLAQQSRHFPITKAIFAFSERLADGQYIASAMGAWGMALLTVTLIGAAMLIGKRLGAIFRV